MTSSLRLRQRFAAATLTKGVLYQLSCIGLLPPTITLQTLERETGIEPATNSLEGCDSTTELLPRIPLAFLLLLLSMVAPRPHREHRQYRQRCQTEFLIVDRDPRQNHQHGEHAHRHRKPLHSKSWCTGEDSNLRSPLGAADLQSAAINHSATCAHRVEQNRRPATGPTYQRTHCQAPLNPKLRNRRAIRPPRKIGSGKLLLGSVLSESSATCLACFCCVTQRAQLKTGAGEGT